MHGVSVREYHIHDNSRLNIILAAIFFSGNELSVDPKLVKKDLSQMLKWRLPKNVYDNFVQTDMSSTLVSSVESTL